MSKTVDHTVLLPQGATLESVLDVGNLPPFGPVQLGFAAGLSRILTSARSAREHPELVALGYWLRPSHMNRMVSAVRTRFGQRVVLPRGLAFHVAPSNVDTIFVYSWLISLLCGNRNILRVSSKESRQSSTLIAAIAEALAAPDFEDIARRVVVIRYPRDSTLTARISGACDVRAIWGGDETIRSVRTLPIPPHATELVFADKFSLAVLRADAVCEAADDRIRDLARGFFNDVYWFAQMACSSPRMVAWIGSAARIAEARERFWRAFGERLDAESPNLHWADLVNKRVAVDTLGLTRDAIISDDDNRISRIWLRQPAILYREHCGAGLLHEVGLDSLQDLGGLLSRRIQTVAYHGLSHDEIRHFTTETLPAGIDRWVPIGHALDFSSSWDGFDLFGSFLREVHLAS